jgi:hypothetical protein
VVAITLLALANETSAPPWCARSAGRRQLIPARTGPVLGVLGRIDLLGLGQDPHHRLPISRRQPVPLMSGWARAA